MSLTLSEARTLVRRWLADGGSPAAWEDALVDEALRAAFAQLDARAPRAATVTVAVGGGDTVPLPSGVRRVLAVLLRGQPLAGWVVWGNELRLAEPVNGAVELRVWTARELPTGPDDPLPLAQPAEQAFLLAAAVEALLERALAVQGRYQGAPGPLEAAVRTARRARERAAAALERRLSAVALPLT